MHRKHFYKKIESIIYKQIVNTKSWNTIYNIIFSDSNANIANEVLLMYQLFPIINSSLPRLVTYLIQILKSKQGSWRGTNHTFPHFYTGSIWLLNLPPELCFLINRTDMFSPLKALQLPRVINLLQLNYCTKCTPQPVKETWTTAAMSGKIWICIKSKWVIESSQRVMRICSKIMRRINHCRFTRHLGSE